MRREEFVKVAAGLRTAYQQRNFMPDQKTFDLWFSYLQDLPYEQVNAAAQKYILSSAFPPTIADIRNACNEVAGNEVLNEMEAWRVVYKAICNSNYHAEEEFNKLPPLVQKAIGNPDNLKEMAGMDINTVNSVEQSHFIRVYRTEVDRERELSKLPTEFRQKIGSNEVLGISDGRDKEV